MERRGSLVLLGNFSHQFTEELKIASVHDPPFVYVNKSLKGNSAFSGYLVDLWKIISEELNLTYQLLPPSTSGYGARLANGTWTGMVGDIAKERADVALSWLCYREDRAMVVDYLDKVPVFTGGYNFYVRAGVRDAAWLTGDMFASLLRPLHTHVWLVLLLCLLVLGVGLMLTMRLNRDRGETERTCREFSLGFNWLATFMTVTGQGWPLLPDSCSARIVTISSWVMGILISMNYTANLISHLAISSPELPISSLEEFISKQDWTFAMEDGVGDLGDWATSPSPAERHLYHRAVDRDRFLELNGTWESVHQAAGPKTLVYYNLDMMFTWINEEACHLLPVFEKDTYKQSVPNYIIIGKTLGLLRKQMNSVMQRMLQVGTLDRLKRQWFGHSSQTCSDVTAVRPLTMADLLAVLVITPLAAAVSCLLLLAELLALRLSRLLRRRGLLSELSQPGWRLETARRHSLPPIRYG